MPAVLMHWSSAFGIGWPSLRAAGSVCILLEMLLYGMRDIALHSQMMYNSGRKTKSNVMM
jgi:hypothetical protein